MPADERYGAILRALVAEQGITRFGVFDGSGEGLPMPGGLEEFSGYLIDDRGRHFAFWVAWDETRGDYCLSEWESAPFDPEWLADDEYRRARADAGREPGGRSEADRLIGKNWIV